MPPQANRAPLSPGRDPLRPWVAIPALALIVAIVALFAALLPMAAWRADEYHDFGLFRLRGWSFFFERLLAWSPRPLSEALAGLYHLAVEATGRPLIVPALALLWATLLAAPLLHAWRAPPHRRTARLVLGGAVLCLFLLGHAVSEMFFWPMGAVAYLPTLAAISLLTVQVMDGRWRPGAGRGLCLAALLVAAASAEVGAIFAILFAAAMIGLHATAALGRRRDAWAWAPPLALGLLVMVMLSLGRGRLDEHVAFRGLSPNPALLHHPLASLARSVPTYARQLVALDATDSGAPALLIGAALKTLAALGLTLILREAGRPAGGADDRPTDCQTRTVLAALALCLQATLFLSIAGAYHKFGLPCCERHDTLRQGLLVLTVLCAASLVAGAWPGRPHAATIGIALTALALLLLLVHERPTLRAAYAARDRVVRSQRANWRAGHAPGARMVLLMPPVPPLVGAMTPPGRATYRLGDPNPWVWDLVMTYFGKRELTLEPN